MDTLKALKSDYQNWKRPTLDRQGVQPPIAEQLKEANRGADRIWGFRAEEQVSQEIAKLTPEEVQVLLSQADTPRKLSMVLKRIDQMSGVVFRQSDLMVSEGIYGANYPKQESTIASTLADRIRNIVAEYVRSGQMDKAEVNEVQRLARNFNIMALIEEDVQNALKKRDSYLIRNHGDLRPDAIPNTKQGIISWFDNEINQAKNIYEFLNPLFDDFGVESVQAKGHRWHDLGRKVKRLFMPDRIPTSKELTLLIGKALNSQMKDQYGRNRELEELLTYVSSSTEARVETMIKSGAQQAISDLEGRYQPNPLLRPERPQPATYKRVEATPQPPLPQPPEEETRPEDLMGYDRISLNIGEEIVVGRAVVEQTMNDRRPELAGLKKHDLFVVPSVAREQMSIKRIGPDQFTVLNQGQRRHNEKTGTDLQPVSLVRQPDNPSTPLWAQNTPLVDGSVIEVARYEYKYPTDRVPMATPQKIALIDVRIKNGEVYLKVKQ